MQLVSSYSPLKRYWIVFVLVFVLHNLEEIWRDLPAWSVAFSPLRNIAGVPFYERMYPIFVLAALGLTAGVALTGYTLEQRRSPRSAMCLAVFCMLMLVNAIYHVMLSVWTRTVMPGVITAIVLIIPVYVGILYRLYELSHTNKQAQRRRDV